MVNDVISPSGGDAVKALSAGRASLVAALDGATPDESLRFERAFSRLLDSYFRTRMVETGAGREKIALIAVGGYGRAEVCLGSDIDILILCRRRIPPKAIDLAQPLFLPLWDAGYTLGHGFRTISDCVKLASKDNKVLSSLMDARIICGDASIFDELCDKLREKVLQRRQKTFMQWLDEEQARRLEEHGDGAMLLEPSLKEGIGGLREYHRLLWLARLHTGQGAGSMTAASGSAGSVLDGSEVGTLLRQVGLSAADCALLDSCVSFLHDVRNRLHALSGRKNDRLHLDLQAEIANRLGFEDCPGQLAVEVFLGRLHRVMADVKGLTAAFRRRMDESALAVTAGGKLEETATAKSVRPAELADPLTSGEHSQGDETADETASSRCSLSAGDLVLEGGNIHIYPPEAVREKPELVLAAYLKLAEHPDTELGWETRQAIGRVVEDMPELLRGLDGIGDALMRILVSGRAFRVMEQMVDIGLLSQFLPAFRAVRDRVQFDGYHTYPVGRHTLFTIQYLELLGHEAEPPFSKLWAKLEDTTPLLLAALFHDLGKGGDDASNHSAKGADIVRSQLTEWGIASHIVEEVAFLVENHMLLGRTAHGRDLADESVVAHCGGIAGTQERLDMLFVLTYADARATGPKAWSRWSASLLDELYGKVSNILRDNTLATPSSAQTIQDTHDKVRQLVEAGTLPACAPAGFEVVLANGALDTMLGAMPSRYALAVQPEDILSHMGLVYRLNKELEDARRRLPEERAARGLVVLEPRPLEGKRGELWELVFVARDQQGLFSTVSGVLALHGLNVFGADAFVWADGTVLDIFRVSAPPGPLYAKEFWVKLRGALQYALTGKLSLEFRIDQMREKFSGNDVPQGMSSEVEVAVDNSLSDFYTVIEVFAPDRPALLYDITRTLQAMRLDILFAKVTTKGSRTADSFSVRDVYGQKLLDKEQVTEVRNALLHALR